MLLKRGCLLCNILKKINKNLLTLTALAINSNPQIKH